MDELFSPRWYFPGPKQPPRRGSFVLAGPPAAAPTHARCCVLLKCRCSFLFIIKKGFDFLQFVLMPQLLTPSGRAVISAANTPLFNQRQRTPATNIEEFFGVLELHRYTTAEMHLKTLTMETNLFFSLARELWEPGNVCQRWSQPPCLCSACSSRRGRNARGSWRTWSRPTRRFTWRRATSRETSTRWSDMSQLYMWRPDGAV